MAARISELNASADACFARGDFAGAEALVREALAIDPSVVSVWARLARIQSAIHDYEGQERTLEAIDRLAPDRADILAKLAKIKDVLGDRAGALRAARRARDRNPLDAQALLMWAGLNEPATDVIPSLEAFVADPAVEARSASEVASVLAGLRNQAARRAAGLPAERALSWDDLNTWTDAAGLVAYEARLADELAGESPRAEALVHGADIALRRGDRAAAEGFFARLRLSPLGFITDIITTEDWPSSDIMTGLPRVVDVRRGDPRDRRYTVFLSSDPEYFRRFTLSTLRALKAVAAGAHAHVHLSDGDETIWAECARLGAAEFGPALSVTAEASGARARDPLRAKDYYHAIRYVRFSQYLDTADCPAWLFDVDADIAADPGAELARLPGDVALVGNPNTLVAWGKIAAGFVGAAPTPRARGYFRLAAGFIARAAADGRLRWYIDQLALYLAFARLRREGQAPEAWFPGEDLVSINSANRTAKINFVIGARKHIVL